MDHEAKAKAFFFSLSLPWLALDGTLQPWFLIQTMSIFTLLPKLQMISNISMASLMTWLMRYVIIFRHTQPQMNHLCILRCFAKKDHIKSVEATEVKICDHKDCCHWTLMLCKDLPVDVKTIMAIWSFKCKRFPDGTLNKHKAGLCVHRGQQTWGLDYWDTYAPVVMRASI